jgi:periplasmic divalent cation tolerance protein
MVVLSTTASVEDGIGLGRRLVDEHLAACVNVVPSARSIYRWEGRVEEADEALLLIKTRRDRYADLARRLQELHSYAVPEVLALSVAAGAPAYVNWVSTNVRGGESSP